MAKRLPADFKRLTAAHLTELGEDELGLLVQRIEVQTQTLNRAMRLVAEAMEAKRRPA
jgi:hypothetical protein